ncbi:methyl-accepting chemotaxis protein [Rhizobacter sp. OV335]|uniref:methyl-accepting chemotaxis protein n=1 Tax=Rhizobacter sp. OV335 TaxID=1500264 RepID=UPI00091883CC|nr:methyl-accepting chemotaxis protein [Rhizobacter sp. OV335]SHN35860.1 Methyl-accepting chemotaxis protein [Rhizobacter sp. OV335]
MKLNHLKLGQRLGMAFGLILAITALVSTIGVWRLETLKTASQALATTEMQRHALAARWAAHINLNWVRTAASLKASDATYIDTLKRDMDSTSAAISEMQKKLDELVQDETGKQLMADVATRRESYRVSRVALFKRKQAGEDVGAQVDKELQPLAQEYLKGLVAIDAYMDEHLAASQAQTLAVALSGQRILAGGAVFAVLAGLLLAVLATRSMTGPLHQAVGSAEAIAEGDLSRPIHAEGRDECAQLLGALGRMRNRLSELVSDVRRNAEGVATASAEISHANNDLSGRTEEQASALQETAAAMDQLSSTVRMNADNARQANVLAQSACEVAVQGGDVVGQVVDTMKGINDSSKKIVDIIGVIDGIAFQTNILALNAAVEAARAGEQGRGFAVVAGEVRTLAQRSADAAKEIKALISTSVERVEQGTLLVDRAGTTMQDVVNSIRRVTDIVGEISTASSEQSTGVSQIGEAVTQMDTTTQQNAAMVEQGAAAAESLKAQAQDLVNTVAVFKLAA